MSFSILGTGSALPPQVVTNDDLSKLVETNDEWIRTRTGIGQRHVLTGNQTITELALTAAQRAMDDAGITADELDYIICPTITSEYVTPSMACQLQGALGANCPALDVNAACSGFIYGLDVAAAFMARGGIRHILVVAAEALSNVTDWTDRSTCVLFGDGAGAAVLAPGDNLLYMHLTSQCNEEVLYTPFVTGNYPGRPQSPPVVIHMDGGEVYKFAVNAINNNIQAAMQKTNLAPDDIDHVLLHQANLRIIDAARRKLGIPHERYAINIEQVGNMSAASIPVLLDQCNKEGRFKDGDILVMGGFGGGLTTGTAVLRWKRT